MMPFLKGASLTAGLIISLGPQNIELIRLGLLKQKTFVMASVFILCDIVLVVCGAAGFGNLISSQKELLTFAKYIAVLMLYYLASQAFMRMRKPVHLAFGNKPVTLSLAQIIRRGLMLSFFNPLVILETLVLVGSTSAQYPWDLRVYFIFGSLFTSFVWFYSMVLCTQKCSILFLDPNRQRILEGCIGLLLILMGTIIWCNTTT